MEGSREQQEENTLTEVDKMSGITVASGTLCSSFFWISGEAMGS